MLRLDWNLLFTVINILILYLLMKKFLFKPINAIITKRKAKIEEEQKQASNSLREADSLKQQYEDEIKGAKKESEKIISDAGMKAKQEYDIVLEHAKAEADKLLETARKKTEEERESALNELTDQIGELAMQAAGKIVLKETGSTLDQALYEKFLDQTKQ